MTTTLQKADLAIADLSSNGGLLQPEQGNAFIINMMAAPTMIQSVRRVVMTTQQQKINRIGFGKRILRAGTQGGNKIALNTAAASGAFDASAEAQARAKPTTSQILLTTKEVIAEVRLPYDVLLNNIERGNLGGYNEGGAPASSGGIKNTIMTMMGERAAVDLEELFILGDTALVGSDPYLGMVDGCLKQITSNVVDAGGQTISRTLFKNGMKTLPSQYRRNRAAMGHFISTENEIEYRDVIGNRETAAGDAQIGSTGLNAPVFGAGSPIVPVALLPGDKGILTNPQNLIFAIQQDIHVETDRDIRNREFIIVLTMWIDVKVDEEAAAVKYINIAA